MHAVRNLLRRLAGALVALTLAMFAMGPSLDALICHDEFPAWATAGTGEQTASFDDGGAQPPDSSPHQPCVHGHCHHSFQSAPVGLVVVSLIEVGAERHVWPTLVRLATLAPSGLERPPRA